VLGHASKLSWHRRIFTFEPVQFGDILMHDLKTTFSPSSAHHSVRSQLQQKIAKCSFFCKKAEKIITPSYTSKTQNDQKNKKQRNRETDQSRWRPVKPGINGQRSEIVGMRIMSAKEQV
jgi:hypothetical protein